METEHATRPMWTEAKDDGRRGAAPTFKNGGVAVAADPAAHDRWAQAQLTRRWPTGAEETPGGADRSPALCAGTVGEERQVRGWQSTTVLVV